MQLILPSVCALMDTELFYLTLKVTKHVSVKRFTVYIFTFVLFIEITPDYILRFSSEYFYIELNDRNFFVAVVVVAVVVVLFS